MQLTHTKIKIYSYSKKKDKRLLFKSTETYQSLYAEKLHSTNERCAQRLKGMENHTMLVSCKDSIYERCQFFQNGDKCLMELLSNFSDIKIFYFIFELAYTTNTGGMALCAISAPFSSHV
jgi:hypothetical protein